jgi:hypothetical protein
MSKIKYPDFTYSQTIKMLRGETAPVSFESAPGLLVTHHFVLVWDGDSDPTNANATLGILTGVTMTADETRFTVRTCSTDFDLTYDNAVYICDDACPEVLVKFESGAFVGRLIGVDYEESMAVVQCNERTARYSLSIVTYIDDVNKDCLGLCIAEPANGEGDV